MGFFVKVMILDLVERPTTPCRKRYNDDIYFSICVGGPHGFRAVSFGRGRCVQVFLAVKIVIVIDCIYLWLNS